MTVFLLWASAWRDAWEIYLERGGTASAVTTKLTNLQYWTLHADEANFAATWCVLDSHRHTFIKHTLAPPARDDLLKLMAFHAAVDELFRSYRCRSVYLDVGSNIGVQIRKLYEPEKYPAAPALRIFDDVFGRDRCDVCTIGIEPNPHHTARLTDLERRYRATGVPVLVLHAAASNAESSTQLALEDRDHVNTAEDTGATTVASWQGARAYSSISVVDVRTLDLAALIYRVHRHLQELHGRERPPPPWNDTKLPRGQCSRQCAAQVIRLLML